MIHAIFLVHVGTTLMAAGIMWFLQVIHYPLLRHVGEATFVTYEQAHTTRAVRTVVPLMILESITAVCLLWWRPARVAAGQVWGGLGLWGIIWGSTLCLQIPQHTRLALGFNAQAQRILVTSNWIRPWSYTARVLLTLWMLSRAISP